MDLSNSRRSCQLFTTNTIKCYRHYLSRWALGCSSFLINSSFMSSKGVQIKRGANLGLFSPHHPSIERGQTQSYVVALPQQISLSHHESSQDHATPALLTWCSSPDPSQVLERLPAKKIIRGHKKASQSSGHSGIVYRCIWSIRLALSIRHGFRRRRP